MDEVLDGGHCSARTKTSSGMSPVWARMGLGSRATASTCCVEARVALASVVSLWSTLQPSGMRNSCS